MKYDKKKILELTEEWHSKPGIEAPLWKYLGMGYNEYCNWLLGNIKVTRKNK